MGGQIIYPPPRYSVLTVSRPVSLPMYMCQGLLCPHYTAVTVQYILAAVQYSTVQYNAVQVKSR